MIDTGADISIFKLNKVLNNQPIDKNNKCTISGISGKKLETYASTETFLTFQGRFMLKQKFFLVDGNFPIPTDGILGRDFLVNNKCNLNFETWLLSFIFNNEEISIPIEDNIENGILLPERSEVIRNINNLKIHEDALVCSQ